MADIHCGTAVNFWKNPAERTSGESSITNIAPSVTSKLNQFSHNALLRPIIGQASSTVRPRTWMDEGRIVLVNLAKGIIGHQDARMLGMLTLMKIFAAAMGRVSISAGQRRPFHVCVDEAHNFATDTLANIMAEARKFGLSVVLANQTLSQIGGERQANLMQAILGNVSTLLMFRLGALDAAQMESYLGPDLDAQAIEELPDFHVAARLLTRGRPTNAFVLKTSPAAMTGPKGAALDNAKMVMRLAELRTRYTRPIEDGRGPNRRTAKPLLKTSLMSMRGLRAGLGHRAAWVSVNGDRKTLGF